MEKTLSKTSVQRWVKKLKDYVIYTPQKRGDLWDYEIVDNPASINLNFPSTLMSLKKIMFPQKEVILQFKSNNRDNLEITEMLPDGKPAIVFGVRPCSSRSLVLMDGVFGGNFRDPAYFTRRENTALVGIVCTTPPSENCFCTSVNGSPTDPQGLDIVLTDLVDKFFVHVITEKGKELIELASEEFETPKSIDRKELEKIHREAKDKLEKQIDDLKVVKDELQGMFESSFWENESERCIGCGVCTFLCPTCHCFDINDEVSSVSPLTGKRVRTWDNCQFPDFTMHSSGHNPRPNMATRLRQRLLHKFLYAHEQVGEVLCTGCGRCITQCPVNIDIVDILNRVRDHD